LNGNGTQVYTDDKEKKLTRIERIKNLVLSQSISKPIKIAFLILYLLELQNSKNPTCETRWQYYSKEDTSNLTSAGGDRAIEF